jgi:DNA (cytosine-5)-methyltransferase 1
MTAYYNEIDPFAAQWLRNLITAGLIAPGDVDERDIRDVKPDEIKGYTQCHFFAGIGTWSHALRRAGWPDDRPVWTGSCPCQPFSAAGRRGGTSDERHVWPHWFHLVEIHRPATVFGEQVASKDGLGWFDLVSADLEGSGYAVGAADLCAAGFGAPHIRQRLFFVGKRLGDTHRAGSLSGPQTGIHRGQESPGPRHGKSERSSVLGGVVHPDNAGSQGRAILPECSGERTSRPESLVRGKSRGKGSPEDQPEPSCPVDGFWRNADWITCDEPGGTIRLPVEPSTFPLADGVAARVGRIRGYGNGIAAPVLEGFISAYLEAERDHAGLTV